MDNIVPFKNGVVKEITPGYTTTGDFTSGYEVTDEFLKWTKNSSVTEWKIDSIKQNIIFQNENDAALYLLTWTEEFVDKFPPNVVLMPIIRRVMPEIIANEIIGVQSISKWR